MDAPRDYVVWATGTLQNPAEVLQPAVHRQLRGQLHERRRSSRWREAADVKAGKVTARGERLVWKWQADHVPDFAIALSNHYRWDAASTVVDPATGRRASVQAAYPDSATDFKPMVGHGAAGAAGSPPPPTPACPTPTRRPPSCSAAPTRSTR